jgi:hypothetical protein
MRIAATFKINLSKAQYGFLRGEKYIYLFIQWSSPNFTDAVRSLLSLSVIGRLFTS